MQQLKFEDCPIKNNKQKQVYTINKFKKNKFTVDLYGICRRFLDSRYLTNY